MNICLISYEFPPMVGGEGAYTYDLAMALSNEGHNVKVITTDIEGKINSSIEDSLGVIRVSPMRKFPFKLYSFGSKARKKLKELRLKNDFDVVHFTNDFLYINMPKGGIDLPIIATIHHPWAAERKKLKGVMSRYEYIRYILNKKVHYLERAEKKICESSDQIITVSRYTAECITRDCNVNEDKIKIIPNTVNTDKFNPSIDGRVMRKKWNLTTQPIILFVGRLDYHKGIEYLIDSFSKLLKEVRDAKLVIVGEGPLKNRLTALIKDHKLRNSVILAGRVPDDVLPFAYAASDLFVLPSFMEGFGIVLIEAMATEKPCIGTGIGGVGEVIKNGKNGFIIPPGNTSELYLAMKTLIKDRSLAREFGTLGRKRVEENFTWKIVAKKTIDLYEKCQQNL